MRVLPLLTIAASCLSLAGIAVAAAPLCERCIDAWNGKVDAHHTVRHTTLVTAGQRYDVKLTPADANADLVVAHDDSYPPELVLCQSAHGSKQAENCRFRATATLPIYVFVVGRQHQTGYALSIEKTAPTVTR